MTDKIYEIGKRIKQRREELHMTQEELGKALWLNKSTIQRYETGKITKIKVPIIHAMAKYLDVNPEWLMVNTDEKGAFVPHFDKYKQWEEENSFKQGKGFVLDYTDIDIQEEFYKAVDKFCELHYRTADECEIFAKIIRGMDELNHNGLKKVWERICELEYIPDCNNTGTTWEDVINSTDQDHKK